METDLNLHKRLHQHLSRSHLRQLVFGLFLSLLCPALYASPQPIVISHNWVRFTPGSSPMAAYFEIENNTAGKLILRGASSTAFGDIMIHQSKIQHGEATMQAVTHGLTIAAGKQLQFAPGGYHLMLMNRQRQLNVGKQIVIILKFRHHPDIKVNFPVKPIWFEEKK